MVKTKLYQLLQSLTKAEWREFERFVASPYFNTHEKCKFLLAALQNTFHNNTWDTLDEQELELNLLGKQGYNEAYFRIVKSQLTRLLEKFFIQKQLEKKSLYQNHFLKNSLIEKGLFKYFEQQVAQEKRKEKEQEKKKLLKKGMDYYLSNYLSAVDYFNYLQLKSSRNISFDVIANSIRRLDEFFLIHRLHLMNSNLSIQRHLKIEEGLPFLEEVSQMVSSNYFTNSPLMQSYFYALQLFLHPEEEHWLDKIQEQIEQQSGIIPKQELNEFYTILINHYIRKSSSGKNYYSKVLALYKLMAAYDFLCPEQYITEGKFKNIVTLGCLFQEFDWTKTFIETYREKLPANNRDSVFHFNMGGFYFHQQQFEKAQNHLIQVEHFDVYYTVNVRSLLLRIYYETEQYFALTQAMSPFKDVIRKQKRFTTVYKQSYLRFISVLSKLTKMAQNYKPVEKRKNQLAEKVKAYPSIFHQQWLLEKIGEL